jgi:hypothetical protein
VWRAAELQLEAGLDAVASFHKVPLKLERGAAFDSAAEQLLAASHAAIFRGLHIVYADASGAREEGVDGGGLTKEFFSEVVLEVTAWEDVDDHGTSCRDPSSGRALMQRQATVRGRAQPLFRSLPDKSLMLRTSDRPPMYYMALGKVSLLPTSYHGELSQPGTSFRPPGVSRLGCLTCLVWSAPSPRCLPWPYSTAYPTEVTLRRAAAAP